MIMRTLLVSCALLVGLVSLGLSAALAEPAKEISATGKPPTTSTPQGGARLGQLLEGGRANLAAFKAELDKARMDFEIAKLARQEYVEGTYILEKQTMELDVLLSKERTRRLFNEYKRIQQLAKGGEASTREMEECQFASEEARQRAIIAEAKLRALELTKARMVAQLDRDLHVAEAHLRNLEHRYRNAQEQLEQLEAREAKPAAEKTSPAPKGRD